MFKLNPIEMAWTLIKNFIRDQNITGLYVTKRACRRSHCISDLSRLGAEKMYFKMDKTKSIIKLIGSADNSDNDSSDSDHNNSDHDTSENIDSGRGMMT